MLSTKNQNPTNLSTAADEVDDGSGVPLSERGKGESMTMEKRHPIWVLAIIGLTFIGLLVAAVLVIMTYLNVTAPTP